MQPTVIDSSTTRKFRMRGALILATGVLFSLIGSQGLVADTAGPHNYTAIQFQIDDLDNDRENDKSVGWRLLHGFPVDDRWAVEVSASGHRMERSNGVEGNDRFFTLGADGIFNLNKRSYTQNSVSPFIGGGIGLFHDDTNNQPDNAFYANATAGILVPLLGDLARLRIDARYALVLSDSSPATVNPAENDDTRFTEITYGIGIQYALGQQRNKSFSCGSCDSDKDGVRNPVDYCPDSIKFSQVDNRGCAVAPSEEPTAAVVLDVQQTAAEEPVPVVLEPAVEIAPPIVEPQEYPVAPPVVVQQVAIPEVADPAQYIPETVIEPDTPEYIPVPVAAASKPAPIAAPVAVPELSSLQISEIKFENGSARLLPSSTAVLDEVVAAMNDQPNVNYEIQGHTDSQGSDAANLRLSQLRAHSVRNYLIENGVSGWRLTAIGYGESAPIADNDTAAGREKNRRVAFEPTR